MSTGHTQRSVASDSSEGHKTTSTDLRSSLVQSKPVHVEIRPRDTYQHHVAAEAGDLISWSFFTRRKNIAFGLFYLHTHTGGANATPPVRTAGGDEASGVGKSSPTASPRKLRLRAGQAAEGLTTAEAGDAAIKDAVMATRGSVYIQPPASPKPGHGSTSLHSSRAGSVQFGSADEFAIGSTSSLLRSSMAVGSMEGLARSKTMDSRSSVATSGLSIASGHRASVAAIGAAHANNSSLPDLRATVASTSISAPNAVEYIEILPVERYESFEATIAGHYEAPVKGTYVLYFDNSYSINTSKELFLTVSVGPSIPPTMEVLSGWLLKKKQRRLQGWARRWFQLDRKGVLSYFADRFSPCRGSVDLNQCTITKIPQKLMITIDSGAATYHLRATTVEDYSRWSEQFTFVRSQGALLMLEGVIGGPSPPGVLEGTCSGTTGVAPAGGDLTGPVAPVGSILRHTERIHQHMQRSEGSLADLRALAAKEDSGMIKYLAPLERTFQSLQELYDALSEYAVFLQRTGRRMSQVSANRALLNDPAQQQQLLASLQGASTVATPSQPLLIPPTSALISPVAESSILSMDEFYDAEEVVLTEISEESDILDSVHELGSVSMVDGPAMASASEFSDALELTEPPTYLKAMTMVALPAFRLRMPHVAPPCAVSLSNILRRSIGKDWSTISMPVALNEPLSALQRLCEELEYSELLDTAVKLETPLERMAHVVAFAVSAYASSVHRAERKPFTPLLGETFEYERPDQGYRFVAEKVCHRPLIVACHAESTRGWCWWQDQRMKSKFWGKSMEYIPLGLVHVHFADTGDHFVWSKVITCVRNLLSGNKWVENYGEMEIKNERTGDVAKVVFKSNSSGFFSSSSNTGANEVIASITSPSSGSKEPVMTLRGRWDSLLMKENGDGQQPPQLLWKASSVPNDHMEYYGFGQFAITLNDLPEWLREKLPPTDSRFRPDQRQLEEGRVEEAEATKQLLEQRQRNWRMHMEEARENWSPRWFHHISIRGDPEGAWVFRRSVQDDYWRCKKQGKWPMLPALW